MKQIRFDAAVENGVNVYRYLPGDDVPVEAHWAGLYQQWREEPTPWTECAVNNNNTEEIAVYLGLIWRMTDGLARYGIATYYRADSLAARARGPGRPVRYRGTAGPGRDAAGDLARRLRRGSHLRRRAWPRSVDRADAIA